MIHIRKIDQSVYEELKSGQKRIITDMCDENNIIPKKGDVIVFQTDALCDPLVHRYLATTCEFIIKLGSGKRGIVQIATPKTEVITPLSVGEQDLTYVLVFAMIDGNKFVLCKHNNRDTWKIPGGHIEDNEPAREAALRELYEETGITDVETIYKIADYSTREIHTDSKETFGRIYVAHIKQLPLAFDMTENNVYNMKSEHSLKQMPISCDFIPPNIYLSLLPEFENEIQNASSQMELDENYLLASMLLQTEEGDRFLLLLKSDDGEKFIGEFHSYFELFRYINKTEVQEKLRKSYGENQYRKPVWHIAKFTRQKEIVAEWTFTNNHEISYWCIHDKCIDYSIRNGFFANDEALRELINWCLLEGEKC